MRFLKSYSTLLLLLLLGNLIAAQTFLQSEGATGPQTFADFQRRLDQWSRSTNLKTVKGWKWLKRWEDFNARRMNPDGTLPDPKVYLDAVQEVMDTKSAAAKTTTTGNWFPLGPDNYATPASAEWEPGIGRQNCIAFHPTDPQTFWVGVAQGGVWKTVNGGQSWTPLTDDLPMLRVSDIAVNPVNPSEIYLSVGDMAYFGAGLTLDNRKRHTHYGLGVYKTTDGGSTWNPTGLTVAQTDYDYSLTTKVLIHPSNTLSLVAAGTYGIQKSSDAGVTWTSVHDSIIWDLERDPVDPQVLYASMGYRSSMNAGSAGILKSTDFGATWNVLPTGIPGRGVVQRIELAVSPSDHNYVYALCAGMDAGFAGLYRSTNAGASWTQQSSPPNILTWDDGVSSGGQGWYDLAIIVNPTDRNTIYTGGINAWGSTDGGVTWDGISYWQNFYGNSIHADQHQFAYNPASSKYYVCNDGGLYSTDNMVIGSWFDASNSPSYQWPTVWTKLSAGMQTTSFYRCSTTPAAPDNLIAGAQDNSTYFFNGTDWLNVVGGDGMECILDPVDPLSFYASSQYGYIAGSNDGGLSTNGLSWTIPETGEWTTPYLLDPNNRFTLYAAFGNVWKSTDAGFTWNPISNFPVVPAYGQPNISSAMGISRSNPNYIYVAKRFYYTYGEPSAMWVTTDGGASWTDRSAGLPDSLYLTYIAVDADDPEVAYVTVGGFLAGTKVFKTTNAGATWNNISQNLPNLPVNCVLHDRLHAHNPIYVGMDVGVYYTNDTLSGWQLYAQNLPNVIVSELELNETHQQIVAATFGRGLWGVDLKDEVSTSTTDGSPNGLGMQVLPNPNSGQFLLRFDGESQMELHVDIVDIMGRKVFQKTLPPFANGEQVKVASDFAPGTYFLRARGEKTSQVLRFVVQ